MVGRALAAYGPALRRNGDEVFVTDNGNHILDCAPPAPLRRSLDEEWRAIPGVVATGLFFELAPTVLVERRNGRLKSVYDEPMSATAQTLVIGLGNDFRRDDGAGRIAARRIKAETGEDLRVMRKAVKARR